MASLAMHSIVLLVAQCLLVVALPELPLGANATNSRPTVTHPALVTISKTGTGSDVVRSSFNLEQWASNASLLCQNTSGVFSNIDMPRMHTERPVRPITLKGAADSRPQALSDSHGDSNPSAPGMGGIIAGVIGMMPDTSNPSEATFVPASLGDGMQLQEGSPGMGLLAGTGSSFAGIITITPHMYGVGHKEIPVTSTLKGLTLTSAVPAVVIDGSTILRGQTITIAGTPVAFLAPSDGGSGLNPGPDLTGSGGPGGAQGSLPAEELVIGGSRTVALMPLSTYSAGGRGAAAITVGSQLARPTALGDGEIGYVINSQTLERGHPITLGSGAHATVVSLTTNARGEVLLVQGTLTARIGAATEPMTIGSSIAEPTPVGDAGIGYVIDGQTLYLGHPITLGGGSHKTVVSLTTNSNGETLLVDGTKTVTMAPSGTATKSLGSSGNSNGGGNSTALEQSNGAQNSGWKSYMACQNGLCLWVGIISIGVMTASL